MLKFDLWVEEQSGTSALLDTGSGAESRGVPLTSREDLVLEGGGFRVVSSITGQVCGRYTVFLLYCIASRLLHSTRLRREIRCRPETVNFTNSVFMRPLASNPAWALWTSNSCWLLLIKYRLDQRMEKAVSKNFWLADLAVVVVGGAVASGPHFQAHVVSYSALPFHVYSVGRNVALKNFDTWHFQLF